MAKINYITGAIIGLEKKGDYTEISMYDGIGTFFCRKDLGMKVGVAYKFGIVDTKELNRWEIVSIEQQLIKEPAFETKGQGVPMIQMSRDDYRELAGMKNLKIRAEAMNTALKICELTVKEKSSPENYARIALGIAKDLEPYFQ